MAQIVLSQNMLTRTCIATICIFLIKISLFALDKTKVITGGTIVSMEPGQLNPIVGWILVDTDGKIAELAAGTPPEEILNNSEVVDASGKIIIKVFLSSDSNLCSSVFRVIVI